MNFITEEEFLQELKPTTVHHNVCCDYIRWIKEKEKPYWLASFDGCVMLIYTWGKIEDEDITEFLCIVFATKCDCDINACLCEAVEFIKTTPYAVPKITFTAEIFTFGEVQGRFYGHDKKKYVIKGNGAIYFDPCVRHLTDADSDLLKELSEPWLESDDEFIKQQAWWVENLNIDGAIQSGLNLIGYFIDSKICGVVSYKFNKVMDTMYLADLFVSPYYHRRGIGKALVRAVISTAPEKEWSYQADPGNDKSCRLVESLGGVHAGDKFCPQSVMLNLEESYVDKAILTVYDDNNDI